MDGRGDDGLCTLHPVLRHLVGGAARDRRKRTGRRVECRSARRLVEDGVAALNPPPIAGRLREMGYSDRELGDIRDLVEVFSHGNNAYLPVVFAASVLLEGRRTWTSRQLLQRLMQAVTRPTLMSRSCSWNRIMRRRRPESCLCGCHGHPAAAVREFGLPCAVTLANLFRCRLGRPAGRCGRYGA